MDPALWFNVSHSRTRLNVHISNPYLSGLHWWEVKDTTECAVSCVWIKCPNHLPSFIPPCWSLLNVLLLYKPYTYIYILYIAIFLPKKCASYFHFSSCYDGKISPVMTITSSLLDEKEKTVTTAWETESRQVIFGAACTVYSKSNPRSSSHYFSICATKPCLVFVSTPLRITWIEIQIASQPKIMNQSSVSSTYIYTYNLWTDNQFIWFSFVTCATFMNSFCPWWSNWSRTCIQLKFPHQVHMRLSLSLIHCCHVTS